VRTRFGIVDAVAATEADAHAPTSGPLLDEGYERIAVRHDGATLGVFEGMGVELAAIEGDGAAAYVVVDHFVPGMDWCHHEYAVVTLAADKPARLSPTFAECTEFVSARTDSKGLHLTMTKWTADDRSDERDVHFAVVGGVIVDE
jgi:hypothetical protein